MNKFLIFSFLWLIFSTQALAQSDSQLEPVIKKATEEYHRHVFGDKSDDWTPTSFRTLESFSIFNKSMGSSASTAVIEFDAVWRSSSPWQSRNEATLVVEFDENLCQARVKRKGSSRWYRIGCMEL